MSNTTLNIRSDSKDWRASILSNLATTYFIIDKHIFPSVESALQGLKFTDKIKMEEVFRLEGLQALKAGKKLTNLYPEGKIPFVYWQSEIIVYNSIEHRLLLAMFIHEKVRQNEDVQKALLATSGTFIYHNVGLENPNTSLPEKFYIQILLSQRILLQKLMQIA